MMSVENIVQFVVRHNTTLIEVLVGVILVLALLLMIRSFVAAKEEVQSGGSANLGDLEETLKKLLEKANAVPAGLPASADGSDAAQLVAEINTLKLELDQKKKEIEDIKAAPVASGAVASATAGMSEEDKANLEAKIKELEGKLSEYEIISEDIADLSFYKEQNTKLQKELEALKAGGGATPPAAAAAVTEAKSSAAEPEIAGKAKVTPPAEPEQAEVLSAAVEPVVASTAPVEEAAPAAPAAAEPAPAVEVAPSEPALVDDDLLAEFAAAIEKQKSGEDEPATTVAADSAEPVKSQEASAPSESSSTEDAAAVDLGSLDMDKVIAEASGIQVPTQDVKVEDALGTGLDESKLLEEAAALQSVNPEDQKLMGQFENFVKKGE